MNSILQENIKTFINTQYNGSLRFLKPKMFINKFSVEEYNEIIQFAQNIAPFSLQIYHYINNIVGVPKCKQCNSYVRFNTNTSYQKYCGNSCRLKSTRTDCGNILPTVTDGRYSKEYKLQVQKDWIKHGSLYVYNNYKVGRDVLRSWCDKEFHQTQLDIAKKYYVSLSDDKKKIRSDKITAWNRKHYITLPYKVIKQLLVDLNNASIDFCVIKYNTDKKTILRSISKYNKGEEYRAANKLQCYARCKQWNVDNKSYVKQYIKAYRITNRAKIRAHHRHRRQTDPTYKLTCNVRRMVWCGLKRNTKCAKTEKLLGCTFAEYRAYLESKFLPGMSWDNYNLYGWHVDHIKPLSLFNMSNETEQYAAFNYKNTQPLWAIDNLRKSNKY